MKPTRELIDAFRVTADRIESGEYQFDWNIPNNCYCGCLARTVLDLDDEDSEDILVNNYKNNPMWSERANKQYCQTTGIELDEVFKALFNIGLTSYKDIVELEFAGLIEREQYDSGIHYEFEDVDYAINYFRNKANELESQLGVA